MDTTSSQLLIVLPLIPKKKINITKYYESYRHLLQTWPQLPQLHCFQEVRTFFINWGLGLIKVKALSNMSNQLCAFKVILLTIKAFTL